MLNEKIIWCYYPP